MRPAHILTFLYLTVGTLGFSAHAQVVGDQVAADTPTNGFCVQNQYDDTHFFAVDAGAAGSDLQELAPGETLCAADAAEPLNGSVSVFETADTEEGCSRLVVAGTVEGMVKYADFDRCE